MYFCQIQAEPGPVNKLKVSGTSKTSVSLAWTPPERTGGGKIIGYSVEYKVSILELMNTHIKRIILSITYIILLTYS